MDTPKQERRQTNEINRNLNNWHGISNHPHVHYGTWDQGGYPIVYRLGSGDIHGYGCGIKEVKKW